MLLSDNVAAAAKGYSPREDWLERATRIGYSLTNGGQLIHRSDDDTGMDLNLNGTGATGNAGNGLATTQYDIFMAVVDRLRKFGGMLQAADVVETSDGSPIHWAYSDDVGNMASIVGENVTQDSTPVTYQPVVVNQWTYRSGVWPISWQLISDSKVNIIEDVSRKLGIRLARRINLDATVGSGNGQPNGVVSALADSMISTTASDNALTYDDLNNLIHSVDPEYREQEGFALMMHDTTVQLLEQLTDINGRPIFLGPQSFGNITGAPNGVIAVMGKTFRIIVNQSMPLYSQTAKPFVLAGDFKAYKVRLIESPRLEVLRERYADLAAVGVQAYQRMDANLVDPYAIAGLKMKGGYFA